MLRIALIIVLGLLFILMIVSVLIAYQRPAGQPQISVTFLGFTNDSAGARRATFAVSNSGTTFVRRESHYRFQAETATRWTNFADGYLPGGAGLINPRGSELLSVPAPVHDGPWRIYFSVSPDVGVVRDTMDSTVLALRSLGFKTRYRKMSYGFHSDRIGEQ